MIRIHKNNNPDSSKIQSEPSHKKPLNYRSFSDRRPLLGTNVESSSPSKELSKTLKRKFRRVERYRLQYYARNLLAMRGKRMYESGEISHPLNIHKTAKCMRVRFKKAVGVYLSREHNSAFYSGLVVCGNVYACPVCAAKVQERRRDEIAHLFKAAYKGDLGSKKKVIMVTLTFSHKFGDDLSELLVKQSEAFRLLRSGKAWSNKKKQVGFAGLIRSLEVTYGINGWHPHTHEAWVVDKSVDVDSFREWLAVRWYNICLKVGLVVVEKKEHFLERSVQIVDDCKCSSYLSKQADSRNWGFDHELAKSTSKEGKSFGKHPFLLLREYAEGNERSGQIFLDYVFAMSGKAQIFWSSGLKSKVGLKDKSDQDLAEENVDSADLLATLSAADWRMILKSDNRDGVTRTGLLDAAEDRGSEGVKSFMENLYLSFRKWPKLE